MAERRHPGDEALLDAALGTDTTEARNAITAHLTVCASCRRAHDELLEAVDSTLAAVPRAQPSGDVEARALERLAAAQAASGRPSRGPRGGRGWLAVAAAALLGVAVGAGGVPLLIDDRPPDPPAVVSAPAVPLVSRDGQDVGAVSRTHDDDGPRLVVVVHEHAPPGDYTCRVTLADGTRRDLAQWPVQGNREVAWVLDEPAPGVRSVELVSGAGEVWAVADL